MEIRNERKLEEFHGNIMLSPQIPFPDDFGISPTQQLAFKRFFLILSRAGFDEFYKVRYVVHAHLRVTNEEITIQWTKAQRNGSLTNLDILNNLLLGALGAPSIRMMTVN